MEPLRAVRGTFCVWALDVPKLKTFYIFALLGGNTNGFKKMVGDYYGHRFYKKVTTVLWKRVRQFAKAVIRPSTFLTTSASPGGYFFFGDCQYYITQ